MNDNKTTVALVVGLAALALAGVGFFHKPATQGYGSASNPVTVNSPVSITLTPDGKTVMVTPANGVAQTISTGKEMTFGSAADVTTNWTAGAFSDDLSVGKITTLSGTTTVIGPALGAVTAATSTSFSASASSQSLCTIQNKSGGNRILDAVGMFYATSSRTASTGQYFTISLSSTQGATGTGVSLLVDQGANWSLQDTVQQFVGATSTLDTARVIWRNGDWLNFLTANPTSTYSGKCLVSYEGN